ncbi:MAG: type II toxin-antitoxin system VapC family toxin [Chloroflexota bacterium]|nr:type II toxin-antitoxin system VapC family toxin [Chloroflexota bacterium]
MAIYYLDASAVVKYFHREPGTTWVRQIVDRVANGAIRSNLIYLAEISRVEVPAAFAILARTSRISAPTRDALYRLFLQKTEDEFASLSLTTEIIRRAGRLTQTHPLKAYDAVQLAVVFDFNEQLKQQGLSVIFVSGDANLLQAARVEGLAIENPFDHSELDTAR